ncbi:hypothetical protein D9M69_545120 [compost metagenome]
MVSQNQRLAGGFSFCSQLVGKVNQDDGVFRHQTNQHDHTQHGENIQRIIGQRQGQQGTDHRQRNRKQYHKRMHKAVIQRYHDKIYQDNRQENGDTQGAETFRLHFHITTPYVVYTAGFRNGIQLGLPAGHYHRGRNPHRL